MMAHTPTAKDPASIDEIMNKAMKGGLAKKVASGKADDKEKLELLSMMIDLVENDPPQGDANEWKMMAGTVMMDVAKVVVGREGAGDDLSKSMNCKACHDKFKPN
jgi:formylglycine-generating enzyme required for sulfatase activity